VESILDVRDVLVNCSTNRNIHVLLMLRDVKRSLTSLVAFHKAFARQPTDEARALVTYTGGTISMLVSST